MVCALCPKVAWYMVGKKGFCGDHREEAHREAKRRRNNSFATNARRLNDFESLLPPGRKYDRPRHTL